MIQDTMAGSTFHTVITIIAICIYAFAVYTGLRVIKKYEPKSGFQALAVIGSTLTSLSFALLLVVWLINKSSSTMDWLLAVSFEATHIISSLSIAAMHILMARW